MRKISYENEENILVGERIRNIREEMQLTQNKFSEMIDISEVFLGQIERGERSLSLKTLKKIIACTGSSADYILYGKLENNDEISKIIRILNSCSDDLKTYMYDLITSSFKYLKNLK